MDMHGHEVLPGTLLLLLPLHEERGHLARIRKVALKVTLVLRCGGLLPQQTEPPPALLG